MNHSLLAASSSASSSAASSASSSVPSRRSHTIAGSLLAVALAALAPVSAVLAQSAAPAASEAASAPAQTWVSGEIRRVDVAQNRLTVRHADIPHLDMGAMTMVFRLKPGVLNAEQLKALKPGDRVEFQAEAPQGQLTITALRSAAAKPADDGASAASEHHHH